MPSGIRTRTSGIMVNVNVTPASSGVTPYVGPGDLATFDAWWGVRAYSAATATALAAAIDLNTSGDTDLVTVNVKADGTLNTAGLPDLGTHKISKVYDQTGNGNHLTQATHTARMTLSVSSAIFMSADTNGDGASNGTFVPANPGPWCISAVMSRTPNGITTAVWWDGTGTFQFNFESDDSIRILSTPDGVTTGGAFVTANTWYPTGGMWKAGAGASQLVVNTTTFTSTIGTVTPTAGTFFGVSFSNATSNIRETGLRNSDISGSFATLITNQKTFWGI